MQRLITALVFTLFLNAAYSQPTPESIRLAVWVNEAIVATYTFNYKNFLPRQRDIAKYFTSKGWTAYSTALRASKLPEAVQKNSYDVSAVALLPPDVKSTGEKRWRAIMPLLVIYKNPQYLQKQTLKVTIDFIESSKNEGVRGFAIESLQSKVTKPPCQCPNEPSNDKPSHPDERG